MTEKNRDILLIVLSGVLSFVVGPALCIGFERIFDVKIFAVACDTVILLLFYVFALMLGSFMEWRDQRQQARQGTNPCSPPPLRTSSAGATDRRG
jgi:hypothetical protein